MDNDNLKTVLDAGAASTALRTTSSPTDVLVVPVGYTTVAVEAVVEKFLPAPRRIKADVKISDLLSFVAYVNKFKFGSTAIFCSNDGSMVAVLDYHSDGSDPSWCSHRVSYKPVISPEWTRWMAKNGVSMDQTGLAEFLEENQDLVVEPKGAELLELVQTLEGKNHIDCNSLIRLNNGRTKLEYTEDVQLKGVSNSVPGGVEFPNQIVCGIIPFEGGPAYKVLNRMRYRIANRKLSFWYNVVDQHIIIRDAVRTIIDTVKKETGVEPFVGTP